MGKQVGELLIVLMGFVACCFTSYAHDLEVDGIFYNIDMVSRTAWVTYKGEYKGSAAYTGDVVLPASITFKGVVMPVDGIGSSAFSDCSSLTSVTIPNSVTEIGDEAFLGCRSLASVAIPNSVTKIGEYAFWACSSLASVAIPNSVTSINRRAFAGSGLTLVTIPNGVTKIGDEAFCECGSLASVTIPNGVKEIGGQAFYECSGLKTIKFEDGIDVELGRLCYTSVHPINIYIGGVVSNGDQGTANFNFWLTDSLIEVTFTKGSACYERDGYSSKSSFSSAYTGDNIQIVNVMSETPPAAIEPKFSNKVFLNATLYVPKGCKETYQNAKGWENFFTIEEKDFSGIEDVAVDSQAAREVARYNVNGQLLDRPEPGINIVRYSNGTAKKVLAK